MRSPTPSQLRARALHVLSGTELHELIGAAHQSLGPGRHAHPHVERALERALAILRGPVRVEAVRLFARALAAEIVVRRVPPAVGCERLVQLAHDVPEALDAHPWIELLEELSLAEAGTLGLEGVEQRIREAAKSFLGR